MSTPRVFVLLVAVVVVVVVVTEGATVPIKLTVTLQSGANTTVTFATEEEALHEMGITRKMMEGAVAHADATGLVREVVVGGQHIPLHLNTTTTYFNMLALRTVDGKDWLFSRDNYTNASIRDFDGDPSLVPQEVPLSWTVPSPLPRTTPLDIELSSGLAHASVSLGDRLVGTLLTRRKAKRSRYQNIKITIPNYNLSHSYIILLLLLLLSSSSFSSSSSKPTSTLGLVVLLPPFSGCHLRVVNPHTGRVTLARYFNTQDHLFDQELSRVLTSLREGRLALLTSYHDVSGRLGTDARDALHALGSWAAPHLGFKDAWVWAWVVGGSTLAEALVTNAQGILTQPNPLALHLSLPPPAPSERFCNTWPSGDLWEKRRTLCDLHDGFGDLCSCDLPYPVPSDATTPTTKPVWWRGRVAVVVVAADRPQYLYRLLRQLLGQPGMTPDLVLVSVDGDNEGARASASVAEVLGLRHLTHRSEQGTASYISPRISRSLRFALFKALETFTLEDKFIILEDDLVLAPDFHSYMQQTSALLGGPEEAVYAVSAFSHLAASHTAHNAARLQRATTFPSCGWMTTRAFLEETLPKWPDAHVGTDWDYWMGTEVVRGGKELVLPEVPRTTHGGTLGSHTDGAMARWFKERPLTSLPHTTLNLTAVSRKVFEAQVLQDLSVAQPLISIHSKYPDSSTHGLLHVPLHQDGSVWLVRVRMQHAEDSPAFRIVAKALDVWHGDARNHHFGLWRIPYHNVMVLVVGVPFSRYSNRVKRKGQIVQATPAGMAFLLNEGDSLEGVTFRQHYPLEFKQILGLH